MLVERAVMSATPGLSHGLSHHLSLDLSAAPRRLSDERVMHNGQHDMDWE